MSLVKEEDQLRLIGVAHFRQSFEELSQEPHEEGREQSALAAQVGKFQRGNDTATVHRHAHKISDIEGGLTEENIAARGLQSSKLAQDHARGCRGNTTDSLELFLAFVIVRQIVNDRTQVLEVNQRELLTIGPVEDQLKGRGLSVVQAQHSRKQKRSKFGDGCTDRHAFTAATQGKQFRGECLTFPVLANACATREKLL